MRIKHVRSERDPFSLMSAVSFNGNKIITTDGGGAILTNEGGLADRARHLTTTAKLPHRWMIVHDMDSISFVKEPKGCRSNYWLSTLNLSRGNEDELESILEATNNAGLMTRPAWEPMHLLSMYTTCPAMDLSTAESITRRKISIPSSSGLKTLS